MGTINHFGYSGIDNYGGGVVVIIGADLSCDHLKWNCG